MSACKVDTKPAAGANTAASTLSLLGKTLVTKDGSSVEVSAITGASKVIGLYFSAHWCPPCRGFTPKLAEFYTAFKKGHARGGDLEIVFVSSDRNEEAFKEYMGEMPWVALPFADRDAKAALSAKFKVQGIPTFVLIDGATGDLITDKARDDVMVDPQGADFPWAPKPFSELMPATLVDAKGAAHDTKQALSGKVKLLYFSAHWCPPCRKFTPVLGESYKALKAAGKNVEAVFVSSDRDEDQFKEYLGEMPFLALPFAERKAKGALSNMFEVDGIPTLVILDENDKVITTNGRAAVAADPQGANFPWRLKPLEPLNDYTVQSINEKPTLFMVVDAADDAAAAARAEAVLGSVAKSSSESGADLIFLWGRKGVELVESIVDFLSVDTPASGDLLTLVNIPGQCKIKETLEGAAVSADAAATFVSDYTAGKLTKAGLR